MWRGVILGTSLKQYICRACRVLEEGAYRELADSQAPVGLSSGFATDRGSSPLNLIPTYVYTVTQTACMLLTSFHLRVKETKLHQNI